MFSRLAQGRYTACFCFRNGKGLSPGECAGGRERKPSETLPLLNPGEVRGEGGRERSWGGVGGGAE